MQEKVTTLKRITPYEMSKQLGMGAEAVRAGIRQGKYPFAIAIQGKTGRWNYVIYEQDFLKFIKEKGE